MGGMFRPALPLLSLRSCVPLYVGEHRGGAEGGFETWACRLGGLCPSDISTATVAGGVKKRAIIEDREA